jgi:UDP-N-acetylglucosamine 2-epimerase (non-hydrolysing)
MHLVAAAGTRPNLPKVAALVAAAHAFPGLELEVVHTRQHHDPAMHAQLVADLGMPPPQRELPVPAGLSPADFVTAARGAFADALKERPPAAVVVVGDVNSTLACALGAVDRGIPIAHVEAGLRSFDATMPEEHNRIAVDRLARWLFTTEPVAATNLHREGIDPQRIHFVGNTMIDSLFARVAAARQRQAWRRHGLAPGGYALVTLHRPATVDDPQRLQEMLAFLAELQRRLPVVFPVHPRTQARLAARPAAGALAGGALHATPPLGYLDFVSLMADAAVVLTDSGGIQEETTALGVPCLTLRDNTERPITVEVGTNRLVGRHGPAILAEVDAVLRDPPPHRPLPPLWDGAAAARILSVLTRTP